MTSPSQHGTTTKSDAFARAFNANTFGTSAN